MAALPADDHGPQPAAPVAPTPTLPDDKQRSRKRKEPAGSNAAAAPQLPDLPDDVEGDITEELLQELALDGPLQGPAGRPAKLIPPRRRGRAPKFPGRSIAEVMEGLEMVPTRYPQLWDARPGPYLDGTIRDDLMEIYSPPRMAPVATARGMRAKLSVDLLNGWNLLDPDVRVEVVQEIKARRPRVLMMSPPCTWFSGLMNLNWGKITPVVREQAFRDATLHLEFCMLLADLQETLGGGWAFEHPDSAKSWRNQKLVDARQRGALQCRFDQCMFGLVSKVHKIPMRKRTRFLTNMDSMYDMFNSKFCDCNHDHVTVQGSEGGEKRSVWAQRYPPALCESAVLAFESFVTEQRVQELASSPYSMPSSDGPTSLSSPVLTISPP